MQRKDVISIPQLPVPVSVVWSNRKTIQLQVRSSTEIVLKVPLQVSEQKVIALLQEHVERIQQCIQNVQQQEQQRQAVQHFTEAELHAMAEQAMQVIPERVAYYAKLLGVTYHRITIRNQKTRWGSCSSQGNLNFNCLLMMTPPEVLDSVVAHELCHRKHMDHSKAFYAELYRVFPEYDKCRAWLREHGALLIQRMTG